METKVCPACGIKKSVSEFTKNRAQSDGLQTRCKPCMYEIQKKWLSRKPEKRAEYSAKINRRAKFRYATEEGFREKKKRVAAEWRKKMGPAYTARQNRKNRLARE